MNKYLFHYYFQFHLRVGCRVVGFFGLSEKHRLLSGMQNYRVWSSGAISLSSQFSFTLPPPKLLILNHLLINDVNNMRCWDVPPTFHPAKVIGTHTATRRIWSNVCYSLLKKWARKVFREVTPLIPPLKDFPESMVRIRPCCNVLKLTVKLLKKIKAAKTQDSQKAYTFILQILLRHDSSR